MKLDKITLPQGQTVHYADEVTSTNDIVAQMGKEGASPFTALWGNIQTKGRGRLGRAWQTYPDVGLAVSVLVPDGPPTLPLAVSVALHKALVNFIEPHKHNLAIKWPNDILLNGSKLAGILIESHTGRQGKRFYVVGAGMNVNPPPCGFKDAPNGVALEEGAATPPERTFVLGTILGELKKTLDLMAENPDHAQIIDYYKAHCNTIGQQVVWRDSGQEITGTAKDITPNGHLILQTTDGDVTCNVGEVIARKDT